MSRPIPNEQYLSLMITLMSKSIYQTRLSVDHDTKRHQAPNPQRTSFQSENWVKPGKNAASSQRLKPSFETSQRSSVPLNKTSNAANQYLCLAIWKQSAIWWCEQHQDDSHYHLSKARHRSNTTIQMSVEFSSWAHRVSGNDMHKISMRFLSPDERTVNMLILIGVLTL